MARKVSTERATTDLLEILCNLDCDGEPVIIAENNEPRAVLISPSDFKELRRIQKERAWEVVEEIRARNADQDPDEIYRIVTEEVEAVRQKRYEQREADAARGR